MALLNYTTSISSEKTIGEIQKNLAGHGARSILSENDDEGNISQLSFKIRVKENDMAIRLPMDWEAVLRVLEESRVANSYCTKEQAIRVGWRILKSWIDAQMAIYETKMVKMEEIFLPYIVTPNGKTIYEQLESKQFALTS